MDLLEDIAMQIKPYFKDDQSGYEREMEKTRFNLSQQIKRQEEFLKKSNIAQHFFYWMGMINHMSDEAKKEICPDDTGMILYNTAVLASMNIDIIQYSGPASQEELNAIKDKKKIDSKICYWRKI